MSRVAGKRNMMTANAALINPTPSSDFPLLDALDKATRSKLGQRDIKLLKCDFTLPFSFRTATGGARAQQYSKLDPPPSVYAAEPDWDTSHSALSNWWQMGIDQQRSKVTEFVNLSYEKKLMYQDNIYSLMQFQQIRFLSLSKQFDKLKEVSNEIGRKRQRLLAATRRVSFDGSDNTTSTNTTRSNNTSSNTSSSTSNTISNTSSITSRANTSSNTSSANTSTFETNLDDSDEEMEEADDEDGHAIGYFGKSNVDAESESQKPKRPKSKHIASSAVLKRYFALLDEHVKFVEAAPLGNEPLDNTNDVLLIHFRNVEYTNVSGDSMMHPLPEKKWIVTVFGRTELHARRLAGHFFQAIASNDKPDRYQGNYGFHFVCGEKDAHTLKVSVNDHKTAIENDRK